MSDETPTTDTKPRVRLTEADWAEIKAQYELGKATKTELARKYGVSKTTVTDQLNARGAVYGSKSSEVEKAALEAEIDARSKEVEEIKEFKAKQKKMVDMLQSLSIKALTDKIKLGKPVSDAKKEIDTLRNAMATIRMGRDELYHLYDLHRDPDGAEENEELIISEYTPDEIEALNKSRLGISSEVDQALSDLEAEFEEDGNNLPDIDKLLDE